MLRLTKITERHEGEINDLQNTVGEDCVDMPYEKEENTDELIIKVGSRMGLNLQKTDISISHRLPLNTQKYSSRLRPREGARTNTVTQFPKVIV